MVGSLLAFCCSLASCCRVSYMTDVPLYVIVPHSVVGVNLLDQYLSVVSSAGFGILNNDVLYILIYLSGMYFQTVG